MQNSLSRDRLARFRQMLRANFDKSCGAGEADFSKHPGFKMLVKTLNHDPQPLSAGEELELAMKSLAAYRETFDAKEKRVVEERAAQNAISRRKSPFDALDLGSRSLLYWICRSLAGGELHYARMPFTTLAGRTPVRRASSPWVLKVRRSWSMPKRCRREAWKSRM